MQTYPAVRLMQAINCGLKERPRPFRDAPLPFTPHCGDHGWSFTQRLLWPSLIAATARRFCL